MLFLKKRVKKIAAVNYAKFEKGGEEGNAPRASLSGKG